MKLEVYFDYACPYCLYGHQYLLEALEAYPNMEVEWKPCEAHPRPETHGLHSDLCARGMYHVKACNADILTYHQLIYKAIHSLHANLEDPYTIAGYVSEMMDGDGFVKALSDGLYQKELDENNRLAWQEYHFSAVPSMRLGGKSLISVEGIGLSKQMILEFFQRENDLEQRNA